MVLELGFNIALLIFFIYCFFYVGAIAPEAVKGQMDGAQWPQMIIVLLVIFLVINIIKVYRSRKPDEGFKIDFNIKKIIHSKLFIGSILMLVYTFLLDYTGFIATSIVFFMFYSRLLGEKRVKTLLISSVISVLILYVVFNVILDIMLPRGMGIFRNFALLIESLI